MVEFSAYPFLNNNILELDAFVNKNRREVIFGELNVDVIFQKKMPEAKDGLR